MGRYGAFLRGINLGNRRVSGAELCAPFEELGFTDVASFLASGNVAFTTDDEDEDGLAARIAETLESRLGYEVATFLRSAADLARIVDRSPFTPEAFERSSGKLQVMLLPRQPAPDATAATLELASDDDLLEVDDRELYWLPSGGISRSDLDLAEIGRLVGPGTIRTANTLTRMHAKLFAA